MPPSKMPITAAGTEKPKRLKTKPMTEKIRTVIGTAQVARQAEGPEYRE